MFIPCTFPEFKLPFQDDCILDLPGLVTLIYCHKHSRLRLILLLAIISRHFPTAQVCGLYMPTFAPQSMRFVESETSLDTLSPIEFLNTLNGSSVHQGCFDQCNIGHVTHQ